ncbi:hypothetical protein B0H14DRAFT_3525344 [Mycena olivaceomarginata]|nr:hypothetical protein B0H14DRAFT_3525344 [Mycena olivaceomarginata]
MSTGPLPATRFARLLVLATLLVLRCRPKPHRERLPLRVPWLELLLSLGLALAHAPSPRAAGRARSFRSLSCPRTFDFGLLDPDVESQHGQWTPVTRKTARSHRERSSSPTNYVSSNSHINESGVTSTVSLATREMSEEQLIAVARRYESLALESPCCGEATSLIDLDGHPEIVVSATAPAPHMDTAPLSPAVPSGEGTSRSKGKGPDPRNWGGLDFSDEFSESELKAQKEALQ